TPWVQLEFPSDVPVKRVTIMGNRDPDWLKGYAILEGRIEFLDKDNKQLWKEEMKGAGEFSDFDFKPKEPVKGVRFIRFTSTKDEGDKNGSNDVALGEIMVE